MNHGWQLTEDVEEFLTAAGAFLEADALAHTVLLSVSEAVRLHGPFTFDDTAPARFGHRTAADGTVVAAFVRTPPRAVLLSTMDDESARSLAALLPDVPGATGPAAVARAFADATGRPWRVHRNERLFRLTELTEPGPTPAGRARPATAADVPLVAAWLADFAAFIGERPVRDWTAQAERRVASGRLLLWETDGRPVSMVGWTPPLAGHIRIAPVYTPPRDRARGYAGAAVHAACRQLDTELLLFTDLANPTSNALYHRVGFRPLADHTELIFPAQPPRGARL
jgi:predicted GNAT family acetyltransferase